MKNKIKFIAFFSLLLVVAFTGCERGIFCERGEGPSVTQALELPPITGIVLEIPGEVHLSQGPDQSITVTGQQNIIDKLKFDIKDDSWKIDFEGCAGKHTNLVFDITLPVLTDACLSGSGSITGVTPFTGLSDVSVVISGSGNISLDLEAVDTRSKITGSGTIDLDLQTQTSTSTITGSGDIVLNGETDTQEVGITGSGNFLGFNFPSRVTDVDITGSGTARVNCSESLNVDISGSGDVIYRGTPAVTANITGSGQVRKDN